MTLTNAIVGQMVVGNFRVGVWYDSFDDPFSILKKSLAAISFDVRYRKLELGDRDSVTGWRAITYDDTETREMLVVTPTNRATVAHATGILSTYAVAGLTADVVFKGDQIATSSGWYSIVAIKVHTIGDSFLYRECDLEYLPAYEET